MHRSGTSTVARAVNLMGVYLGEESMMMPATQANAEGYWEHLEIYDLQLRLLERMGWDWDVSEPLPAGWAKSEAVRSYQEELARILAKNFGGRALWAWKEPRSCLLLPLWREVLTQAEIKLSCLFVVRNPVEVAGSVMRRDGVPFNKALGVWFHYNIVALKDAAGLPTVFLSYERLVENWEPELRRCAAALALKWPKDEAKFSAAMNGFIQPGLRHNRAGADKLLTLPTPVRDLYQLLLDASSLPVYDHRFEEKINRLSQEFHDYAGFFPNELKRVGRELALALEKDNLAHCRPPGPAHKLVHGLLGKKLRRSIRKRLAKIYYWFYP